MYRLEQEFNRQGLKLSRQTMANWLLKASEKWLRPVYDVLHEQLCREPVLHADETTLQVLKEPGRPSTSKSYMWLYRTSGCAKQAIVLYEYQRTPSVSCKASRAGCTRMGTRATTSFLRISGWLGAWPTRGENLTRLCKRCPKRCKRTPRQRLANAIAPGFSSWSRHWQR